MKKGRAELTHHLGSATDTVAATQSGSLSESPPNPTRVALRKRVVTFVAWDRVCYEQWWVDPGYVDQEADHRMIANAEKRYAPSAHLRVCT